MRPVRIDESLWRSSMLPEGLLEHWRAEDGQTVKAGDALAEVRIEGGLHPIFAPR